MMQNITVLWNIAEIFMEYNGVVEYNVIMEYNGAT